MKFSYSWLKELSGTNLKPRELAERLTMHSFEVERVEQAGKDTILHIDVLPNRAHDCLAHQGVAREIAVLSGKRASFAAEAAAWLKKIAPLSTKVLRVSIADKDFGPRYLGVVIEGLTVKPSPKTIQERLGTLGVKAINNLVDITNYVMLETGMPLHAFDLDRIQGRTMTVRSARMREALTTLDGVMRLVPADTLIIEDAEGLVDLAGTMGGATSAVSEGTTRIFLQAAVFDAARVYRSTRALNFRTEASVRYAAGLSPALAEEGLWRAAKLLEAEGGRVSGKLDIYPAPQAPTNILLDAEYAQRLLGADVSDREIRDILTRVGCRIDSKSKTQKYIAVVPPAVRLDLKTPEDLIEEVGRVVGYEKIPPMMPQSTLVPAAPEEEVIFADRIRDALQGGGLSEAYNYSLINLTPYGATEEARALTLENPMSDRRNHLRTSLVPGLLRNAKENLRFFDDVRLFEVGKIFKSNINQISKMQLKNQKEQNAKTLYPVDERWSVGGIVARKGKSEDVFFELKGILAGLCEGFGVGEVWFDNYQPTSA
ncbi:MAG: phenylalanine--tRNA ligase subunit beta, partial [Patescibacteria group bacterium]|nr:phenylalanine--tRNA ligase subunit beta [Patescibacteria group bacterium]